MKPEFLRKPLDHTSGAVLDQPYRGTGADRPTHLPLPPAPMTLFYRGRLRKTWRYVSIWSRDLSLCADSVAVGPVRQEFWTAWNRAGQQLWERTRLLSCCVELPVGRVLVRDRAVTINVALARGPGLEVVTPSGRAYT